MSAWAVWSRGNGNGFSGSIENCLDNFSRRAIQAIRSEVERIFAEKKKNEGTCGCQKKGEGEGDEHGKGEGEGGVNSMEGEGRSSGIQTNDLKEAKTRGTG